MLDTAVCVIGAFHVFVATEAGEETGWVGRARADAARSRSEPSETRHSVSVQVDYGNLLICLCNYTVEVLVLQVPTQCPARPAMPPADRAGSAPTSEHFFTYQLSFRGFGQDGEKS